MTVPAIAINVVMAFCALLVSFGGYSKYPRLTAMLGGMFISNVFFMSIMATFP